MHLPLRDRRLLGSLRTGALLAGDRRRPRGPGRAARGGDRRAARTRPCTRSCSPPCSAAVLLPALQEAGVDGHLALPVMAQVTIADVLTIVAIPIVLQPSRIVARAARHRPRRGRGGAARCSWRAPWTAADWVQALRARSKQRRWALDLRLSLLRALRARLARPARRHEHPDRRLRRRRDRRHPRRAETALDAGARRRRRLLRPALLRRARRDARRRRAVLRPVEPRARGRADGAERRDPAARRRGSCAPRRGRARRERAARRARGRRLARALRRTCSSDATATAIVASALAQPRGRHGRRRAARARGSRAAGALRPERAPAAGSSSTRGGSGTPAAA